MDVNIRFRFNQSTGEVEVFEVDQEVVTDDPEHNREHDLLAANIGGLLEKMPRVIELPPDGVHDEEDRVEAVQSETDRAEEESHEDEGLTNEI